MTCGSFSRSLSTKERRRSCCSPSARMTKSTDWPNSGIAVGATPRMLRLATHSGSICIMHALRTLPARFSEVMTMSKTFQTRSFLGACVLMLIASLALVGCGRGYKLQGKVIRGEASGIELVHSQTDPRLKGPGLANAEVMVRRDPNTLHS